MNPPLNPININWIVGKCLNNLLIQMYDLYLTDD